MVLVSSTKAAYEFQYSHDQGSTKKYAVYALAPFEEPFNPRDFDSFTFISDDPEGNEKMQLFSGIKSTNSNDNSGSTLCYANPKFKEIEINTRRGKQMMTTLDGFEISEIHRNA